MRTSDMRFVIRCTLLLLALVGTATVYDRWTSSPAENEVAISRVRQRDFSDDVLIACQPAKKHLQPVFLAVIGLGNVAYYRPGLWRRCPAKMRQSGRGSRG
ncbi:hypothetical protein BH10PLA2_BH10PLA2_33840 [soil metagenome]